MATEVIVTVIPGGGGDYTTLSGFESGEQRNLVTADEISVAECQAGLVTGDVCTINGWTTDATRRVVIRPASGHEHGGDKTAGFRVTHATATSGIIRPFHDVTVKGIVLLPTGNSSAVRNNGNAPSLDVDSCIIAGDSAGGTGSGISCDTTTGRFWNNFISGFDGVSGAIGILTAVAGNTISAYNNTIDDCRIGIARTNGTLRPKNNIVQNCTSVDYSGTLTDSETNISSDTTSPNAALRSISLTFVDAANGDYHLAAGDTDAIGAGTDLHADANLAFNYDIDGDTRPDGAWDIGADQIPASGITLTADGGSYTLSGTDAGLLRGYYLAADGGSYTLTGTAAALARNLLLSADGGSYTLTGGAATLRRDHILGADAGSYELSGTAADLLRNYLLGADSGTYTLTGEEATLTVTSQDRIIADSGSYALTGGEATLTVNEAAGGGGGGILLIRRRRRS